MDTHSIASKEEISNEITKTILKNSNIKEIKTFVLSFASMMTSKSIESIRQEAYNTQTSEL